MMHAVSTYSCPRCENAALYIGQAEGVTLHGCAECGGVWLNAKCAQKIADAMPKEAILLSERVASHAKRAAPLSEPVRCPVCGKVTARTHVAAAGVEIDVCGVHGTWYDRNELHRIAKALEQVSWKSKAAGAAAVGVGAGAAVVAGAAVLGAGADASRAQQAANSIGLSDAVDIAEVGVEVAGAALDVASNADVLEGAVDVVGGIFSVIGAIFD